MEAAATQCKRPLYTLYSYPSRKLLRMANTPMAVAAIHCLRQLYTIYTYPTRRLLRVAKTPMAVAYYPVYETLMHIIHLSY